MYDMKYDIVFLLDPLAKVLDRLTRRRWLCRQCVVFLPGCPAPAQPASIRSEVSFQTSMQICFKQLLSKK